MQPVGSTRRRAGDLTSHDAWLPLRRLLPCFRRNGSPRLRTISTARRDDHRRRRCRRVAAHAPDAADSASVARCAGSSSHIRGLGYAEFARLVQERRIAKGWACVQLPPDEYTWDISHPRGFSRRFVVYLDSGTCRERALPRPSRSSHQSERGHNAVQLKWMAGCWRQQTPTVIDEQWMALRRMMLGLGRTVRGDSLVLEFEQLRIFQRAGHAVYHAEPSAQRPTDFEANATFELFVCRGSRTDAHLLQASFEWRRHRR